MIVPIRLLQFLVNDEGCDNFDATVGEKGVEHGCVGRVPKYLVMLHTLTTRVHEQEQELEHGTDADHKGGTEVETRVRRVVYPHVHQVEQTCD